MNSAEYIVAVDIGTTKIACMIGEALNNGDHINVVSAGLTRNQGSHKGMILSQEEVLVSLRRVLEQAGGMAGLEVVSAVVNLSNPAMRVLTSRRSLKLASSTPVTREYLARAVNAAKHISLPKHRTIIHISPSHYILDGRVSIREPIGEEGERLEVSSSIITVEEKAAEDIAQVMQRTRCLVERIAFPPVALEILLPEETGSMRTLILDMGGGGTSWGVFEGGNLLHAGILAVGGEHVTNDIALALGVSFEDAEYLKLEYGEISDGSLNRKEMRRPVEYYPVGGRSRRIRCGELMRVVDCRIREVVEIIQHDLDAAGCLDGIQQVMLAGGVAMTPGMERLAEEAFKAEALLACPQTDFMQGELNIPILSTVWGMLYWGIRERRMDKTRRRMQKGQGILGKTFNWFVKSI